MQRHCIFPITSSTQNAPKQDQNSEIQLIHAQSSYYVYWKRNKRIWNIFISIKAWERLKFVLSSFYKPLTSPWLLFEEKKRKKKNEIQSIVYII